MTVFTNQQEYCRRENLELACTALKKRWDLNLSINKKHDIILNKMWKVCNLHANLNLARTDLLNCVQKGSGTA